MKLILPILFITLLASSCNKPLDEELIGKWDYTENSKYIVQSVFVSDTTQIKIEATINFQVGGKGNLVLTDSTKTFEWTVSEKELTITYPNESPITNEIIYNIKNEQMWGFEKSKTSTENGMEFTEEWVSVLRFRKL